MAPQPTYILSPNFHFKPGTGPIALGNIISHPLRPHRALTMIDGPTLQKNYPRIETITDYERTITRGDQRDVSISLWSEFLQAASGKISGGRGRDVQTNYTMDCLETMYFVTDPSLEEIRARLKAPRVQAVTKASRIPGFRTPVYMVTGLMIAKGFSADVENKKHRNGEIEISGNAPAPALPVGAGVNMAESTSTKEGDRWRAGADIVFAYQLLKIEIKGWKGDKIEYDELRHKAAYLGKDDDDTDEEEDGMDEVLIAPTNADALLREHGAEEVTLAGFGEGENRVSCIYSRQE